MVSDGAATAGTSAIAAGRAASSWGAASGSGPLGLDSSGAGRGGGPAGAVADFPAGEDEAGWGPDPLAGESPADAVGMSGKRGLAHTTTVLGPRD
jgi:hypothetical protein